MKWSNYGKWHIDHIKPMSKFNLMKIEDQYKCCNYKNLQPLWAEENLSKGDRMSQKFHFLVCTNCVPTRFN